MSDTDRRLTPLREISNTPDKGSHMKPSMEDQQQYTRLMKQARKAAEEGHPRDSLKLLNKAAKIVRTEKVLKRIARIEEFLKENGSESESEEDSGVHHVGKGFYLHTELYNKLYSYQREALMWFWRLHRKVKGGILGDDMGLGKTIQVISFLSGLFYLDQVKTVMVVLPVALIINWEKEFEKWSPGVFVESYHSSSKRERERALAKVQRRGGVMLTSYGLVLTNADLLSHHHGNPFTWDYVILDEGHKIKNPSKTTKAIHRVPATHRLILTGTPIQNNLKELWALFDFVTQGTLLGTVQTFNSEYANPITRAREKDATGGERCLGNQMAESLRELIAPYFLRRTKADVVKRREESSKNPQEEDEADKENERVPEFPTLTRKNDFVIWLSLTEAQIKIYQDFISLDQVKELLMTSRSPLVELTILKKLCDHPRLLPARACIQLGLERPDTTWADEDDDQETPRSKNQTSNAAIQAISDDVLMMESCKLQFLIRLLTNLRQEGHRTLVFSQSRKMLDIIEKVLNNQNFQVMRLDGTITKLEDREKRITSFQRNNDLSVFLLTTQVGGVGLTLTGADRVVIFDPSWNPATDSQAVDRVYRIGQTRSVVIYRLITCSTVEEKIYRRQIFKDSLTKQATGTSKNPYRYFSRQELRDLFILDNPQTSTTQQALEEMHAAQRKTDTALDEHIAFMYSLDMFGLSDHDLMFSQEADTENKEDQEQAAEYVQHRVTRAKELVSAESDLSQKLREQTLQDTQEPGSMLRHHRQYDNRQTLLDHAAKLGQEVNVPAFNKRRDDYERKNRSPSESEEELSEDEEQEEQEDLNMSMANMTLQEQDIDAQSKVTKGQRNVNQSDRPPSSQSAQGASVICIEDSDDEDGNRSAAAAVRRNESDLGTIEDSDSEVTTSPQLRSEVDSTETSEYFTENPEARELSFGPRFENKRVNVKDELKMLEDSDRSAQDLGQPTEEEGVSLDQSTESEKARLKRLATTPKESLYKRSRISQTPQSEGRSPGCRDNSADDSIQEIPPTPISVIDLTDSDADMSQSFEEIEQRTIATSPLAASRQSLLPDSPPRPISTATEVGELEKNVDSDYYMESAEEEDFQQDYTGSIPSDKKASACPESPDSRPGSTLQGTCDMSPEIEQRSVALSPMIHDESSASSPENTSVLKANPRPTAEEEKDDAWEPGKGKVSGTQSSSARSFRYNSDSANYGGFRGYEESEQAVNVTCQLSFDDTKTSKRTSDANAIKKLEGSMEQSNEENYSNEEKGMSELEQSMTSMSAASGDEHSGGGNHGNEDVGDEESDDDVAVASTRRRQVIEASEEEEMYESINATEDASLLENSNNSDDGSEKQHVLDDDEDVAVASTRRRRVIEESEEEEMDDSIQDKEDASLLEDSDNLDDGGKKQPVLEDDEDFAVASTRRRRVIKESEDEKMDDSIQDKEDASLLEDSSNLDDGSKKQRDLEDDGNIAESDVDDDDVHSDVTEEEQEEEAGVDVNQDELHKNDDDSEDDKYEDSFINDDDDEDYSDEVSSGSDEEYEESEEDEEGAEPEGEEEGEEGSTLSQEECQRYTDLVSRGRLHQESGNIKKALSCFLTALDIDDGDRSLQRRAYRLAQQYKQQSGKS
ncbi:DNA excision repair protein ERCC-6-like [Patiria miniata]|uniref:DNA excision repair protein ERCC-6-like n=1 Tax=Patiria miniata TaxID=46514 RepID=A0A914A612_PATMI|nr:DNA excision repair protein ERCC-6-like [Patiria miniata]